MNAFQTLRLRLICAALVVGISISGLFALSPQQHTATAYGEMQKSLSKLTATMGQ